MDNSVNTRELVLEMLIEILEKEQYSHLVLRAVLDKYQYLTKQERAFITRLTEGTIESLIRLDYVLNQFSKTKVKKMKPLIRNVLRMSVYQILYMDRVPDSAVCNEAVKIVKKRGLGQLSGFVNGVLRSIARGKDDIRYPQKEEDYTRYLSVTYSVPEWIIRQWLLQYSPEQTEAILRGFSGEKELFVRTNLRKITPERLVEKLAGEGVCAQIHPQLPYALGLRGVDYLMGLPSFQEGDFYVQDISSMMVAQTAAPKQGDYVIDVCAAPGGKSTHLAELLDDSGYVDARDLTEYKVDLIRDNIERHKLDNIGAKVWDATVPDEASVGRANILICDLPCSGLGVMGNKTDIRYKMTEEKQKSLVVLQRQILSTVWRYVKKGGSLIYSTCTIHQDENEGNVEWFLSEHPQFRCTSQQQIFPGTVGRDGFFIARLIRDEE